VSAGGRADTFGSAGLYSPSGGECKAFRRQFTDPVDLIARSGAPVDRWSRRAVPTGLAGLSPASRKAR